jgi:hypothetical protein
VPMSGAHVVAPSAARACTEGVEPPVGRPATCYWRWRCRWSLHDSWARFFMTTTLIFHRFLMGEVSTIFPRRRANCRLDFAPLCRLYPFFIAKLAAMCVGWIPIHPTGCSSRCLYEI